MGCKPERTCVAHTYYKSADVADRQGISPSRSFGGDLRRNSVVQYALPRPDHHRGWLFSLS
jgi:hypothetical protein